jgi:hypothetical protein
MVVIPMTAAMVLANLIFFSLQFLFSVRMNGRKDVCAPRPFNAWDLERTKPPKSVDGANPCGQTSTSENTTCSFVVNPH